MRNFYCTSLFTVLIAIASLISYASGKGTRYIKSDTNRLSRIFVYKNDKSYLKNGIHVTLLPLKPNSSSASYSNNSSILASSKIAFAKIEPSKTLSNVQIYPIPITTQINLRYTITRNSNVTIKIMDVLGNDVVTLFSQRVDPGDQKITFNLNDKLSSGFYLVRLIAGSESIIKRISIL